MSSMDDINHIARSACNVGLTHRLRLTRMVLAPLIVASRRNQRLVSCRVASSLVVAASAVVSGHGGICVAAEISNFGTMVASKTLTIMGPLANNGSISTLMGGHLELVGSVTGSGTITLAEDSHLSLQTTGAGQTVIFSGPGATLQLRSPISFAAAVQGFGKGDAIAVDVVVTGVSFAGGVMSLNIASGTVAQIRLAGTYSIANLHLATTANGASIVNFHP